MVLFAVIPMYIYNNEAYSSNKVAHLPAHYTASWYISFEDALWNALAHFGIPTGSTILVPSFYCVDVINNIHAHGYLTQTYLINDDVTVNVRDLRNKIEVYSPTVVIALHIQGKQSEIINNKKLRNDIMLHALLIEDSVHQLKSPKDITIFGTNHIIITSLRKVSPFTGSLLFIDKRNSFSQSKNSLFSGIYATTALLLHLLYQNFLRIGFKYNWNWSVLLAERVLSLHNNLIGDSKRSGSISRYWLQKYLKLPFQEIQNIKKKQYCEYARMLPLSSKGIYSAPSISEQEMPFMRGFPVIVKKQYSTFAKTQLRKSKIYFSYQLDDCDWSKRQNLLLLPLGPQVTISDITVLCTILSRIEENLIK